MRGGAVQPPVELPAHAVGDDSGGEVIEPPQTLEPFAVLGLGDDQQSRAHVTACRQLRVQLIGERAADERRGVDALGRRVEGRLDCELWWWRARRGRSFVEP